MSVAQVDKYVVHAGDVIRMETHCPISAGYGLLGCTYGKYGRSSGTPYVCLCKEIADKEKRRHTAVKAVSPPRLLLRPNPHSLNHYSKRTEQGTRGRARQ